MGQNTGRAFITVAGKRLASKENAKLGTGSPDRTGEVGDTGVLGYTEKDTIPYVECTIKHNANTSMSEISAIVDATISFDTDTGRSYVLRNAWCAKSLELSGGDIALRFEAMSCEEV